MSLFIHTVLTVPLLLILVDSGQFFRASNRPLTSSIVRSASFSPTSPPPTPCRANSITISSSLQNDSTDDVVTEEDDCDDEKPVNADFINRSSQPDLLSSSHAHDVTSRLPGGPGGEGDVTIGLEAMTGPAGRFNRTRSARWHSTTINAKGTTRFSDIDVDSSIGVTDGRTGSESVDRTTLHVGGLFRLSSGSSDLSAAELAIEHINRRHYVPGYRLQLIHNDTRCDPGRGADAFYDMMYRKSQIIMLVGTACAEVTKTLADIVPYWNLLLISHASSSPALSEKARYPTFYRLVPTESSHNAARRAFIRHFRWNIVASIQQDDEMYSLAMNQMIKDMDKQNLSLKVTLTFRTGHYSDDNDIETKMNELKDSDARIIIGSFNEETARKVFCEAHRLGLYGRRYVWMLLGRYSSDWWKLTPIGSEVKMTSRCTVDQLSEAIEGYFAVDSLNAIVGGAHSISGLTTSEFLTEYQGLVGGQKLTTDDSVLALLMYDTIWTVAYVLRQTASALEDIHDYSVMGRHESEKIKHRRRNEAQGEGSSSARGRGGVVEFAGERVEVGGTKNELEAPMNLSDFSYREGTGSAIQSIFSSVMEHANFVGVSGSVSFDGPDRRCVTSMEQNQHGHVVRIGLYYPESNTLDFNCTQCRPIQWIGERVPVDRTNVIRVKVHNAATFVVVSIVCSVGIALASVVLAFNIYNRKIKLIKLSSPKLNNVAVIGCMHVYLAVILLGTDDSVIPNIMFSTVCSLQTLLFSSGFTLTFGAMFMKTYRIHQICRACHSGGLVRNKMLQDTQLLTTIGVLLIIDCIIIVIWMVLDPMQRQTISFSMKTVGSEIQTGGSTGENLFIYEMTRCSSQHLVTWTIVFYVYKGLLLVFGVYLAWETRSVQIPALNDSQYIGLNIYNVLLSSVTVVTLYNILSDQPTLAYAVVSALVILSTTSLLALLFLPKLECEISRLEHVLTQAESQQQAAAERSCLLSGDPTSEAAEAQRQPGSQSLNIRNRYLKILSKIKTRKTSQIISLNDRQQSGTTVANGGDKKEEESVKDGGEGPSLQRRHENSLFSISLLLTSRARMKSAEARVTPQSTEMNALKTPVKVKDKDEWSTRGKPGSQSINDKACVTAGVAERRHSECVQFLRQRRQCSTSGSTSCLQQSTATKHITAASLVNVTALDNKQNGNGLKTDSGLLPDSSGPPVTTHSAEADTTVTEVPWHMIPGEKKLQQEKRLVKTQQFDHTPCGSTHELRVTTI